MEQISDAEAAAIADAFWERAKLGAVEGCIYLKDGNCSHARRPCAAAVKDAMERQEPSSGWCIWTPPEG